MIQQENKGQGNAITRNQSKQQGDIQQKEALDMIIPTLKKKEDTRSKFIQMQKENEMLKKCFELVGSDSKTTNNAN